MPNPTRKHTTKTSVSVIMDRSGDGANIRLKWSWKDQQRPAEEVAKDIIFELAKIPDYSFLRKLFPAAASLWAEVDQQDKG